MQRRCDGETEEGPVAAGGSGTCRLGQMGWAWRDGGGGALQRQGRTLAVPFGVAETCRRGRRRREAGGEVVLGRGGRVPRQRWQPTGRHSEEGRAAAVRAVAHVGGGDGCVGAGQVKDARRVLRPAKPTRQGTAAGGRRRSAGTAAHRANDRRLTRRRCRNRIQPTWRNLAKRPATHHSPRNHAPKGDHDG